MCAAKVALVIGNSRYTAGWGRLPGVSDDVDRISVAFAEAGFDVQRAEDLNGAAMRTTIEAFAQDQASGPDDCAIIYYAGHGETLRNGAERVGYLVPVDAPRASADNQTFRRTAISMDEVQRWIDSMRAKHVLVIFDSCFSGSIFQSMRGERHDPPVAVTVSAAYPVRQIIASGTEEQAVPDQSVFAHALVSALAGGADLNRDGYVTGNELGFFLRDIVANQTRGKQTPQFATLMRGISSTKGDFIFQSPVGPASSRGDDANAAAPPPPASPVGNPGRTFQDCPECPQMTILPPGRFYQGSPADEPERNLDEQPRTSIEFRQIIGISTLEATFAQWDACFREGGCTHWLDDKGQGRGRLPVFGVTWDDARQFAAWLNNRPNATCRYRLPTEAEWEYAARGGMTTSRPWGDDLGKGLAACADCGGAAPKAPLPAGSFPANRFGLHDVIGNVWEWVEDCYADQHAGQGSAVQADAGSCASRVIRGGSFATASRGVRSAARAQYPPGRSDMTIGFRVACDFQ
ncbi:SUMF1/EgtB/PvdO family nonheme iron enzyme [Paramagnetospirillum marisnigri]|uniref:SUMF1/EgtB/PvdO family nonheme iron enzyme n=1 Tax=Paramagnetospirillum marisnigri TaxID=1285242 RepID=UPI0015611945|nr:SUMF1/EgtB/PvdO family nonheme iron enzyme [Paramagnetospirillum marisnigri]